MMKTFTLSLLAAAAVALPATALGADAKTSYEENCAKCHGQTGKGDTKMGKKVGCKDYSDPKVVAAMDDAKALKNTKEGMKDGDKVLMKPFKDLSDQEIKDLIAYMKSFAKK